MCSRAGKKYAKPRGKDVSVSAMVLTTSKGKDNHIGIVKDRGNYPIDDKESNTPIDLGPPRHVEWIPNVCNLRPIKGQDTHSETGRHPEQLVNNDIVC
jgi:hypothetical protein